LVRLAHRAQGLAQRELSLLTNTGERFIGELEAGKSTCQLGKALAVATALRLQTGV